MAAQIARGGTLPWRGVADAVSRSDEWWATELARCRVVGLLRGAAVDEALALSHLLWDAGGRLVEIPLQRPQDVDCLRAVAAAGRDRGAPVGAGTVLAAGQVRLAAEAGAQFAVSPGTDDDVIAAALDAGLAVLPGVSTATEIQRCLGHGLHHVKAFPASVLGPEWFAAMRGPFPDVAFVATGGVTAANAASFLAAGAAGVAIGSALADLLAGEGLTDLR
jgi:2-dehydro-3-deoxyphosphogluconate aldolase/(4S)-4-hydroxy-2-oxoglutarate aldolase